MIYMPARAEHPAVQAFRKWRNGEAKLSRDRIAEVVAQHNADFGKLIREKDRPDE